MRSLDDTEMGGEPPIRFALGGSLHGDLSFSPDGDFLLCCTGPANEMQVLDLHTSTDAVWGSALRSMALPVATCSTPYTNKCGDYIIPNGPQMKVWQVQQSC